MKGKDILSEYGPDSKPGGKRASCGGIIEPKPLPYDPPVGPKSMNYERPGLGGGMNHGNRGTQGKH